MTDWADDDASLLLGELWYLDDNGMMKMHSVKKWDEVIARGLRQSHWRGQLNGLTMALCVAEDQDTDRFYIADLQSTIDAVRKNPP